MNNKLNGLTLNQCNILIDSLKQNYYSCHGPINNEDWKYLKEQLESIRSEYQKERYKSRAVILLEQALELENEAIKLLKESEKHG